MTFSWIGGSPDLAAGSENSATGFASAHQLAPEGQARALPAGSTWDEASGIFYWQPAAAFLRDLEIMLRTFIAGAASPAKPRAAKPKPGNKSANNPVRKSVKKSVRKNQGDRE